MAMLLHRLADFVNRRLDELYPRPWLDQWTFAHDQGWQPDDPSAYCRRCGSTIHTTAQTSQGCPFCLHKALPWNSITRLSAYDAAMASWVHQLKFNRQWKWASLLGRQLGLAMTPPQYPDRTYVCPVPLHLLRRIRRGYNQSQLLAQEIARVHNLPVVNLLRKDRYRQPQSSLTPSRRKINVRQAYTLPAIDLTGCHFWLVDDVKTTGATLRACSRLLKQAGATRIDVAVLAVADPHSKDFKQLQKG